jgi:AcrR family transcriptional regulator
MAIIAVTDLETEMTHQREIRVPPQRGSGRPRSAASTQAILDATLALLAEQGFTGMSMDEIARRARAGKDTLYRRWPSKVALVIDAIDSLAVEQVLVPDTGELRQDLLSFVTDSIELLTTTDFGRIVAGLVGEGARNPEFAEAFHGFWASRRRAGRQVLERAVARGDLRPDTNLELGLDLVIGPVFYRLLVSGAALDRGFASELVEHALQVLAAPGR